MMDLQEEASQYAMTFEGPIDLICRSKFSVLGFPLNDSVPGPSIQDILFRTGRDSFCLCLDGDCRGQKDETSSDNNKFHVPSDNAVKSQPIAPPHKRS